ncbi:unnamed protein product [Gemmata massiliana]|uniref:Uncharacterized protein n=1 Tax=Gemmata massiliana TaxID=1210884 RepID=A0A6P2D2M6_9BACT|nr:hypothetical protein [Gemmata massiliana]VTR95107.1 unnamed protein product [Gemmata massiliana]
MPYYKLHIPGGEVEKEYTLELNNDGTFSFSFYVWDTMAGGGDVITAGRWTRTGDTITFEMIQKPMDYQPVPTTATVVGDTLEMNGVGTFT